METDEQFGTVMGYVSANPVRAGLVERPELYRWSAHRALVGDVIAPAGLDVAAARALLEPVGGLAALSMAEADAKRATPRPGRPARVDAAKAADLAALGMTHEQIAQRFRVSRPAVTQALARHAGKK